MNAYSFPAFQSIALGILSLLFLPQAWSSPQDLRHFDAFIHHVRQEAASGDPERIMDCFAEKVVTEPGCDAVHKSDVLGAEAQRFGWTAIGRDIARFSDGFALIDAQGTMSNLHARSAGQNALLEVTGNRVKLRRSAGAGGEVIAMLDKGTFTGKVDGARWVLSRDGVDWTPVVLDVPDVGRVKGYISSDYIRATQGHGDLKLVASFDGKRWALTGYERVRTDLKVTCAHPMP